MATIFFFPFVHNSQSTFLSSALVLRLMRCRQTHTERKKQQEKKRNFAIRCCFDFSRREKKILLRISQISKPLPKCSHWICFFPVSPHFYSLCCTRSTEQDEGKKTIHTPYLIWHQTKRFLKLIFNYLIHLTNAVDLSKEKKITVLFSTIAIENLLPKITKRRLI